MQRLPRSPQNMTEAQLMADLIQLRRDTAANWTSANPTLSQGEQGYETDTGKMKIGDGSTAWTSLAYFVDSSAYATSSDITTAVSTKANTADLATVATSGSYDDLSDQPTIPSIDGLATETYVDTAVSNLVDAAPGTLDTLNELAAALGDDADFATTTATSIGLKANTADLATVATTGAYSDLTGTPTVPSALTDLSITDGTAGQVLSADGDGTYTFIDAASGGGGSFEAVASGSLSDGSTVVLNADGTVSVVAETGLTAGFGTATTFGIGGATRYNSTFDSNSNKVVIAYSDPDNSEYGNVVVGTVSGKSISFGTPVIFNSAQTWFNGITFDSNSNKVVIAYRNNGNSGRGTAIVGTVSGTTISFGSPTVFETKANFYTTLTFDSNSNKVVIAYMAYEADGNTAYGRAIVGTVSGTGISFGTSSIFHNGSIGQNTIAIIFDSNSNKVVIAYEEGNDTAGRAIVGTVSGTSISFGTSSVFHATNIYFAGVLSATFDSNSNKVVLAYTDQGNSYYGTAVVGTVSGTSISFGSPVVFTNVATFYIRVIFDPSTNKVVMIYRDNVAQVSTSVLGTVSGTSISFTSPIDFYNGMMGQYNSLAFDSNSNKVIVFYDANVTVYQQVDEPLTTNLTAENYAGIADAAYADAATATIQTAGSVDDAQSGLTPGQAYYVQANGTLGLTPDTPSVFAGTAVSATSLLIGKEGPASTVAYADVTGTPTLATVATSGAYADITGTPTVPTALTDLSITDGTAGQVLSADGDGTYTFIDAASGGGGGSFEAVASGEISVGDPVIVKPDGSVTVARADETLEIGNFTTYETSASVSNIATSYTPDMAYDALSDKIVMIQLERNPSTNRNDYLEARVLTVTDGVISAVSGQFRVANAPTGDGSQIISPQITADGNGKFLICWHARSGNSTDSNMLFLNAKVATVSGTALSFGTEASIESNDGVHEALTAFVPDVNKFVIFYQAYNTSTPGEVARYVKTATISGTSVSFGAALRITTGYPAYNHFSYVGNSKIATISGNDTLIIYEVSGTSVVRRLTTSIESAYVPAATDVDFAGIAYDPNSGKGIIFIAGEYSGYTDTPSGGFNQVFTFTVSASNVVTYGTPTEVVDANGNRFRKGWYPHIAFNTSSNIFLIGLYGSSWPDSSAQYAFTAEINNDDVNVTIPVKTSSGGFYLGVVYAEHVNRFVLQNDSKQVYTLVYEAVTNVTTQNFVGFSSDTYSDGDTSTIKIVGSIDDNQSGLTPGIKYYLQPTGSLSTVVGNPEVFAGTAISSTKLIIKG
jgi:hypothetical protein